jgi:hypothetical protein
LRVISKLSLEGEFDGVPMPMVIREITLKAKDMSYEEVVAAVDKILGLTEDESMVWVNLHVKKSVRDLVIIPAFNLAIKHMPESQKIDDEGNAVDPGKGAACEVICANFLADPNYNQEEQPDTKAKAIVADADDADAASVEAGEGMIDEDQPTNDE